MTMTKQEFTKILYELGTTQKNVASILGVDASTISRFLSGDITINQRTEFAIRGMISKDKTMIANKKVSIAPRCVKTNCWAGHPVELTMTATDGMRAMYRGTCKCGEEIKLQEVLTDDNDQKENR